MPLVYNKTTGERIQCDKEQLTAMVAGNYSLEKPDLEAEAKAEAEKTKTEEAKAAAVKAKSDQEARATAAKTAQAKKDSAKLPGNK